MYFPAIFLFLSLSAIGQRKVTAQVTIPTNECNVNPIDIQFILDAGKSIGQQKLDKIKNFVKDFVDALEIGPEKNQIGLLTFSAYSRQRFWLKQYTNKQALLSAIDCVNYNNYVNLKYLGNAFEMSANRGFTEEHGGRDGAMKVIIVITDGKGITHVPLTTNKAERVQNKNIRIITVGIGNNGAQGLQQMASDPSRYISAESFDKLGDIKEQLLSKTCEVCPYWSGSDAVLIDWRCYRFFSSEANWENAKTACEAEASTVPAVFLAEVKSEATNEYVANKAQEVDKRSWLGASDAAEEGKFVWTTEQDEANIDPTWWGEGQPDNDGGENCLIMRPDRKLNDYNCGFHLPYFCESADVVP